jgi:hypothetical protein
MTRWTTTRSALARTRFTGAHTGVVAEAVDHAELSRRARQGAAQQFERAVNRERDAIALREHAAAFHQTIAAELDDAALTVADSAQADRLRRRAATERDAADGATGRPRACVRVWPPRASQMTADHRRQAIGRRHRPVTSSIPGGRPRHLVRRRCPHEPRGYRMVTVGRDPGSPSPGRGRSTASSPWDEILERAT